MLVLLCYGYITERSARLRDEHIIRELVITHDAEMRDTINLLNDITFHQMRLKNQLHNAGSVIMDLKRTIYQMYTELRKYNKQLPPWGDDKPLEPSDKWIKNDTEI